MSQDLSGRMRTDAVDSLRIDILDNADRALHPAFYNKMTLKYQDRASPGAWTKCAYYAFAFKEISHIEMAFLRTAQFGRPTDEKSSWDNQTVRMRWRERFSYPSSFEDLTRSVAEARERRLQEMWRRLREGCPDATTWTQLYNAVRDNWYGLWSTLISEEHGYQQSGNRVVVLMTHDYRHLAHVYQISDMDLRSAGAKLRMFHMISIRSSVTQWLLGVCKSTYGYKRIAFSMLDAVKQYVQMLNDRPGLRKYGNDLRPYSGIWVPMTLGPVMYNVLIRVGFRVIPKSMEKVALLDQIHMPDDYQTTVTYLPVCDRV